MLKKNQFIVPILILLIGFSGCAYYNTFFNAEERFAAGEKKISQSPEKEVTAEIRKDFYTAIDKSWKLINIYGDSSSYADDALLLIGKSYFSVEEFQRAERYLRQFISKYTQSELFIEAHAWLGKTLIRLDKDDEALNFLLKVLASDSEDELKAEAYFFMGQVYFKKEAYDLARNQFRNVIELSGDDNLRAQAQFLFAESYYKVGEYATAAENYREVLTFDAHVDILFQAIMQWVHTYRELNDYDAATALLEDVVGQGRFLHKKGTFEAEIGENYRFQERFAEASEIFSDVLRNYPRTEGAAIASFRMAQIFENYYANLDSARGFYLRVTKEFRKSELKEEADRRAAILEGYRKIHQNIENDLLDRVAVLAAQTETTDSLQTETETETESDSASVQRENRPPKKLRSIEEIEASLQKNLYAKAEYFLLNMANYDSAEHTYKMFLAGSLDSVLVPKAFYSLYYIYTFGYQNQLLADSMKLEIQQKFPDSPYTIYFKRRGQVEKTEQESFSPSHYMYLESEAFLYSGDYESAIKSFSQIAQQDSGSLYAQKSRYAIAWIYENKLEDIQKAIEAYTTIVTEYPNSEMGKIAKNKIKVPVVEEPPVLDESVADSANVMNTIAPDSSQIQTVDMFQDSSQVVESVRFVKPDSVNPSLPELPAEILPEPVPDEEH